MKGVQDEAAPSWLVPLSFITGYDPFEQMAATVAAAEHFRRRQGQGGARRTLSSLSLFWVCRNARAECKRKTIL